MSFRHYKGTFSIRALVIAAKIIAKDVASLSPLILGIVDPHVIFTFLTVVTRQCIVLLIIDLFFCLCIKSGNRLLLKEF